MSPNPFRVAPRFAPGALRLAGAIVALSFLGSRTAAQNDQPAPASAPAAVLERPLTPPTNDAPDERPSPQHVWIPGHWRWGQGSYVWVAGRWEIPPVPYASWMAPQWVQQGAGYVLREGFWQQNPPPPQAPATTEIAALQPPPPPRSEAIPEQPSPAHVWLPGYWDFRDNQFVWVGGRWEVPPRANLTYVPAHWESRGDRYVLVAGYWRDTPVAQPVATATPAPVVVTQPAPQPVVVVTAPPAPPREVVYARPSPGHVWIAGYWAWRSGRYVWIAGHWERPPHGHRSWIEPRWEHRGGTYVFIEGHWR